MATSRPSRGPCETCDPNQVTVGEFAPTQNVAPTVTTAATVAAARTEAGAPVRGRERASTPTAAIATPSKKPAQAVPCTPSTATSTARMASPTAAPTAASRRRRTPSAPPPSPIPTPTPRPRGTAVPETSACGKSQPATTTSRPPRTASGSRGGPNRREIHHAAGAPHAPAPAGGAEPGRDAAGRPRGPPRQG